MLWNNSRQGKNNIIRDSIKRGEDIEYRLINFLKNQGIDASKNEDKYDIDLIVNLTGGRTILIEVEETSYKTWSGNSKKPSYPSKLLLCLFEK